MTAGKKTFLVQLKLLQNVLCCGRRGEELGTDLLGSPVMASNDPEERATFFRLGWRMVQWAPTPRMVPDPRTETPLSANSS